MMRAVLPEPFHSRRKYIHWIQISKVYSFQLSSQHFFHPLHFDVSTFLASRVQTNTTVVALPRTSGALAGRVVRIAHF